MLAKEVEGSHDRLGSIEVEIDRFVCLLGEGTYLAEEEQRSRIAIDRL